MFVRYLLLTLWPIVKTSTTITFDDYDDIGLLNCNWAAAYMSNEEIVNDPEIQHEIMLLASHWEGRFGRHGVGADLEKGFLLGGSEDIPAFPCVADYDSGLIHVRAFTVN